MKSKILAACMIAAMAATAAACGRDDSGSGGASTGGGGDKEGLEISYISPVASQPGQKEINLGLDKASQILGWKNSVLDANLSADKQVAAVDTAITQKRAAIASWTLDPGATAGAYSRAIAEGIPVIGMNSEGEGVTATVWWEMVTCNPGGTAEQEVALIQKLGGKKTIILGGPPAPSITDAVNCFTAAAKKAGLEIITTTNNTNDNSESGQKIMQDLLTKHPDVEVVWSYNDATALGASAAITGAGKKVATASGDQKGIVIIGHNGDQDALAAIREKRQTATWDTDNVASGMAAVKQMKTALDGGVDKKYPELVVKSNLVTDETIADYKPAAEREYTLDNLPLVK
jgi:ribose transport system substrate-binding protein